MRMIFTLICSFVLRLIVAIEVYKDPDKNADDRGEDTEEGNTGKLVDNLDTEEDDESHDKQHSCSINLKKRIIRSEVNLERLNKSILKF